MRGFPATTLAASLVALAVAPLAVTADEFPLTYTRASGHTLVFGEPRFVRAVGMFSEHDSGWGHSFARHPATIHLDLHATELDEQLRILEPFFEHNVTFYEAAALNRLDSPDVASSTYSSDYSKAGFIQATILQAQDIDLLGLPDGDAPLTNIETYCCTPFYADQGLCPPTELGALIIDRKLSHFDIWTYDIPLLPRRDTTPDALTPRFIKRASPAIQSPQEAERATYRVRTTGEHVLILSHCDPTLNTEVSLTGTTVWRNPFGFLPGRLFGHWQFHKLMFGFYILFAIVWAVANFRHRTELTSLQLYTSIVIGMCVIEQGLAYAEYSHFNQTGVRSVGIVTLGIIVSVARQAISRMLVICVALGYQIVKPSLGPNRTRLFALGGMYFAFETALELVVKYQETHPLNDYYRIYLTLPVSLINALFSWWLFHALYQILTHLAARKQTSKYRLYRTFAVTLACALFVGLAFGAHQAYATLIGQSAWHWSQLWFIDGGGCSLLLYTVVLVAIALLFRPSKMATRYAYTPVGQPVQHADDEDNDEPAVEDDDTSDEGGATTRMPMMAVELAATKK